MRRPWGLLQWLVPRIGEGQFDVICGLNPAEDRSLAAASVIAELGCLRSLHLVYVESQGVDDSARAQEILAAAESICNSVYTYTSPLLSGLEEIVSIVDGIRSRSAGSMIFDISALPKRFFFPILRFLRLADLDVLLAAVGGAVAYPGGPLRMNPLAAMPIPGFELETAFDSDPPEVTLIGIGRETLGLYRMLDDESYRGEVHCLMPFPSTTPSHDHGLDFLTEVEPWIGERLRSTIGVFAADVPSVFSRLALLARAPTARATLIPYGPKSISLAMCLLASIPELRGCLDVVYAQPQRYAERYSYGVQAQNGVPSVRGYPIILGRRDLYRLD